MHAISERSAQHGLFGLRVQLGRNQKRPNARLAQYPAERCKPAGKLLMQVVLLREVKDTLGVAARNGRIPHERLPTAAPVSTCDRNSVTIRRSSCESSFFSTSFDAAATARSTASRRSESTARTDRKSTRLNSSH